MDTMKSTLKMSVKKWKQKILKYVSLLIHIIQQVVWSEDELKQLGQIMVDNDVWIISDEIHCDIKRDGQTHVPFAKAVPDYDKIVTAMSQSKAFNIAGLMFSNIIIPNRRLLKTWKLHHFSSENPLSIVATQAYEKGEDWLVAMNDYLDDNFKYLAQFLEQELPHAEFKIPEATYLAWVDLSYYIKAKHIDEPIANISSNTPALSLKDKNNSFITQKDISE